MEAEIRFLRGWVRSSTFEYFTVNKALISTSASAGLIETRIDTDNFIGIGAGFFVSQNLGSCRTCGGFRLP
jgi:hypothetical protein